MSSSSNPPEELTETQSVAPVLEDSSPLLPQEAESVWVRMIARVSLRESGIAIAFIAVFLFLSIDNSGFLTSSNLLTIFELQTSVGFVALAGTLLIISGAFDISVGATYALTGVVAAKLTNSTDPTLGFLGALAVGSFVGAVNGFFVGVVRVNALIVTLATNTIVVGIAETLSNGALVQVTKSSFGHIGNAKLLGVPWSVWIALLFAIFMGVLLQRTVFGRRVYAVGGNSEAANLSGVRVSWMYIAVFTLSGLSAAIASVLYTSQISVADPTTGTTSLALTAIAAVVVGGTSIRGGEGAVWRTVVGVLLLGMISDGFNLLGINPLYQEIVQGSIILIAVSLDMIARRTQGGTLTRQWAALARRRRRGSPA